MFQIIPEYPEFAWLEGIVNAVTHREYGMSGGYIKIAMFDDRLEITSPGKLPNIVTVDNIRLTLFFASTFWTKLQNIFGHCCMSKLDKVAKRWPVMIRPAI